MAQVTTRWTPFTTIPQVGSDTFPEDIDTRNAEMPSRMVEIDSIGQEMNAVADEVNANTQTVATNTAIATNAALMATGTANNKGAWSLLTGALNVPASVNHNGSIWVLNRNIANVALSEPTSLNTDWTESSGVTQFELDAVKTDVSNLEADVSNLEADVSNLEADVSNLEADVSNLETNKLDTTLIHNATSKTTPANADELALLDSEDVTTPFSLKKVSINTIKNILLPSGVITMWSGSIASIPAGWALCNGANGTPDLRNRFIIGASADNAGVSNTSVTGSNTKTGGSKDAIAVDHTHTTPAHTHTGSTNTAGEHTHTGGLSTNVGVSSSYSSNNGGTSNIYTSPSGSHSHTLTIYSGGAGTTGSTGSSGTDANLPPYLALAYIMKL